MVKNVRQRIENGFENYGRLIARRAWVVLLLPIILVGVLGRSEERRVGKE